MTEKRSPFFTVVIPTYRRPEMLKEAVSSVLSQSFVDFELIVVDDDPAGSGRSALGEIVDPRLEYIANDRGRGGAGTRNAGIFRAKGDWVAFLDDDDVWIREKLSAQHRKIVEAGPDFGMIYTGYAVYDFAKREVIEERRCDSCDNGEQSVAKLLYRNYIGGFFSVAIRTDVLQAVGGLDERFPALQDVDLYVRVAQRTAITCVDEIMVLTRKDHSERITGNTAGKLMGNRLFWQKYRSEMRRDPRLMHRAASRVFTFAVASGDLRAALSSTPWLLAGLVVAPGNMLSVVARSLKSLMRFPPKRGALADNSGP
ncbi:MAG: glycosyltransferase family 2 protein [Trueperaceae bacterium]